VPSAYVEATPTTAFHTTPEFPPTLDRCCFFSPGDTAAKPIVAVLPRRNRLARPHPEPGRDTDEQRHHVLHHEDREVRGRQRGPIGPHQSGRTRQRVAPTHTSVPRHHPVAAERELVEMTGDDDGSRDRVEGAEYPNFHHQLLKLVRPGAVLLHHRPNPEHGSEAGHDEARAGYEVDHERGDDEAP